MGWGHTQLMAGVTALKSKLEKCLLGTRGAHAVGGGDPEGLGAEDFLGAPSQPCFLGHSAPAALGAVLSPTERQLLMGRG